MRCLLSICVLACLAVPAIAAPPDSSHIEFFERCIRPLLAEHCYECHSAQADTVYGGFYLDSTSAIHEGGDSGPAVDREHPEQSLLLDVIEYEGDVQMPPEGKLPDAAIADLKRWIQLGTPVPDSGNQPVRPDDTINYAEAARFWSFQPVQEQPLPTVRQSDWPQTRPDHFVLAAMEQQQLSPAAAADRRTLIRRLSFDLTGLPPSPEDVAAFVSDPSEDAVPQLIERLLASPHYGEKWGRMWLDMARYTDKTAGWLFPAGRAWMYRDWVVQAFNEDMPYDQFVHRQLATDLMDSTDLTDLPALGFLSLSPTYWKELKLPCEIINTIVADEWEERVDAVSRTFLGLTVACARCHDHKYDPISSEDYYGLAGVFASCRQVERPMIAESLFAPVRTARTEVQKLEKEIAAFKKQKPVPQNKIDAHTAKIKRLKSDTPHYDTPMVSALSEEALYVVRAGKTPQDGTRLDYRPEAKDLPCFIRGNPNRPGPVVPRRFLTVLSQHNQETTPRPLNHGSGRLDLARAITEDAAALSARVIVNRIWREHFGVGLVDTPSNFGTQGSRPTHPELLDDLAARFIAGGWSIKQLHRDILLSATWQQSTVPSPTALQTDPQNRWLSHMNRRRLNFEEWRDAMLAATGTLDRTAGGESQGIDDADNHRRTLYATVHRRDMAPTLRIHDFPDPTQHSPQRVATTTALQGLYALNGPLLMSQSAALLQRLSSEAGDDPAARIDRACQLLYSRLPTDQERQLGLQFVTAEAGQSTTDLWKQYLHVLLASNDLSWVD